VGVDEALDEDEKRLADWWPKRRNEREVKDLGWS